MGSSSSTPKGGSSELKEKAETEAQVQQLTLDDLHRYINDSEDLELLDLKGDPIIQAEAGFRLELGGLGSDSISSPVLEEAEKHSLYYKTNFCNKPHLSYVGGNGANPVVVSLVQLDKRKQGYGFSGLVRTKKDDLHYSFVSKDKKSALKHLLRTVPDLQGTITLTYVKDPSLSDELAHMEDRMLIKAYRVGVVYAGLSVDENEMFSNAEPSPGFLNFMDWLGKRIKLKGYTGFKGGLDLEHNTTGTHSYATDVQGFDIMFHVSTELPLSTLNPQQVERKRHIGNDVAVIIYQDGPTSKPFAATGITSKFNHVYLVVQAIPDETTATTAPTAGKDSTAAPAPRRRPSKAKNKRGPIEIEVDGIASDQRTPTASQSAIPSRYRLAVVSKHGVRAHGPVLPAPDHVWTLDDTFRNFLLAKTVNAERAAYYAPGFGQARTRRLWLKSLLEKYGPPQKHGSVSPDSLDG